VGQERVGRERKRGVLAQYEAKQIKSNSQKGRKKRKALLGFAGGGKNTW